MEPWRVRNHLRNERGSGSPLNAAQAARHRRGRLIAGYNLCATTRTYMGVPQVFRLSPISVGDHPDFRQ